MNRVNKIFKKNWKLNLTKKFGDKDTPLNAQQNMKREYFTFMNKDKDGKDSTYEMNNAQMEQFEKAWIKKFINRILHKAKLSRRIK